MLAIAKYGEHSYVTYVLQLHEMRVFISSLEQKCNLTNASLHQLQSTRVNYFKST